MRKGKILLVREESRRGEMVLMNGEALKFSEFKMGLNSRAKKGKNLKTFE